MSEATDSAVEAKEKNRAVALIIAVLALLLALAEAGAKNAQHLSTEKNIESSDLYNFYQAKKIRSTVAETAAAMLEAQQTATSDPKAQEVFQKQIGEFKATVARFEKDPQKPEDSLEGIQERANAAAEIGNWQIADSDIMSSEAASRRSRSFWRPPRSSPGSRH